MIQSSAVKSRHKEVLQTFRTRSLLEATRKVLAAGGFDAVTMERVSAEAGLTKGAVYLYFPSKDHLILAAVEEMFAEMDRGIEAETNAGPHPWERLCRPLGAKLTTMEGQKTR